jgi:hypothetical protein
LVTGFTATNVVPPGTVTGVGVLVAPSITVKFPAPLKMLPT